MTTTTTAAAVRAAAQSWRPQQYLQFEQARLRPALELLARVPQLPDERAPRIVDLGAGTGNMAPAFLQRWPDAHVTFVDSSASMLERARADHAALAAAGRLAYSQADFEAFALAEDEPLDLIFSNAALHWVSADAHKTLLPRLLSLLKPGGVLAVQMPDSRAQPSHQLMREAATQLGLAEQVADVRWVTCEREPQFYYELLSDAGAAPEALDLWTTTYAQVLGGENPVAAFTSSTGLGPYLEKLGGRSAPLAESFEAKYRELIARAYPKQADGRTVFNFKRFFAVAVKAQG
jgi:trans-aconitate methyltransferase